MKNLALSSLSALFTLAIAGCGGGGSHYASSPLLAHDNAPEAPETSSRVAESSAPPEAKQPVRDNEGSTTAAAPEPASKATPLGGTSEITLVSVAPTNFTWGNPIKVVFLVKVNGLPAKKALIQASIVGNGNTVHGIAMWTDANGIGTKGFSVPTDRKRFKTMDLYATVDQYQLKSKLYRILG